MLTPTRCVHVHDLLIRKITIVQPASGGDMHEHNLSCHGNITSMATSDSTHVTMDTDKHEHAYMYMYM